MINKFVEWLICLEGEDYIAFVKLVFVVVGGMFALIKWNENTKLKRAEFVDKTLEKIRNDKDIRGLFYDIEYGKPWYNQEFHESDKEKQVDKALAYFSYVCYLRKYNLIKKKEFVFFEYEVARIASNSDFVKYMFNLYHFSKKNNVTISFNYLFIYCKDKRYFSHDFWSSESKAYPHYLNF